MLNLKSITFDSCLTSRSIHLPLSVALPYNRKTKDATFANFLKPLKAHLQESMPLDAELYMALLFERKFSGPMRLMPLRSLKCFALLDYCVLANLRNKRSFPMHTERKKASYISSSLVLCVLSYAKTFHVHFLRVSG